MTTRRFALGPAVPALLLCAVLCAAAGGAAQDAPKAAAAKPAVEPAPQEIRPAFLTPREKSGAFVFLAWTWLAIGVLLYIITLKVREVDRVHRTGLFRDGRKGGKEPPARR